MCVRACVCGGGGKIRNVSKKKREQLQKIIFFTFSYFLFILCVLFLKESESANQF